MKQVLRDVTICAADSQCPALAARALRVSADAADFGDAILFTDAQVGGDAFRVVAIPALTSRDAYSHFILKSLAQYVSTPHVLIVQWDGYVVDAGAWTAQFLETDYIGAAWPWYKDGLTVGNGGFSLRSRRLLEATASDRFEFLARTPEDHQVCRVHRKALAEGLGIRFASEALAARFSYERGLPTRSTFGFHGLFNLWRHLDQGEAIDLAPALPDKVAASVELVELLVQYVNLGIYKVFDAFYARARRVRAMAEIQADARRFMRDARFVGLFDASCASAEAHLAHGPAMAP